MLRAPSGALLALALLASGTAQAKKFTPPPMPAGYDDPGPEPVDPLRQIATGLRTSLRDPYSIRDFALCRSHVMEASAPVTKGGRPWERAYRITLFVLNAKSAYGGYTGLQGGIASFRDGKLERISINDLPNPRDPVVAERVRAHREPCKPVPDAEIQRLLAL